MECLEVHLDYEKQLEKFIERGMLVNNREQAIERLKHISYYKIKEFSEFFMDQNGKYKKKTYFEAVIQNFYFDKNLRMEFFKCSEKIELSVKNKITYILGAKYGAFGYLKFSNWCDRSIPKEKIEEEQERFKQKIKQKMKSFSENPIIKDFIKNNPSEEFPSIWRISEILTFGEILNIFQMMSQGNKRYVASTYNLTIAEFTSYINNMKLVRNLCAHNMAIINIRFKTVPKVDSKILEIVNKPNRISTSILIMVYFIKIINPNYRFFKLYHILNQLIKRDYVARKYEIKEKKLIAKFLGINFNKAEKLSSKNKKYINSLNNLNKKLRTK